MAERRKKLNDKFVITQTSLGQGQEEKAEKLIREGREEGHWVFLQNCHLFKSWMKNLDVIVTRMQEDSGDVHDEFRLILSSQPAEYFPVNILKSGIKMTTEPPRGLKANLTKSYYNIITDDIFEGLRPQKNGFITKKDKNWFKLIFSLCFFHAAI
jgi:dynein heavy chain, axonemal